MADEVEEKKYMTPAEVASQLMVSSAAVRRWAAEGKLKALTTPGGHRRFLPDDVKRFAEQRNILTGASSDEILRVLVVDDDVQFSGYLVKMLNKYPENIIAELVNNGFDAGIKIHEFRPDVVLLDLMMLGMDGFQVCERLKNDKAIKHTRVIAMTGYPSANNVEKILSAGAEVCLSKPVDRNELLELLGIKRK